MKYAVYSEHRMNMLGHADSIAKITRRDVDTHDISSVTVDVPSEKLRTLRDYCTTHNLKVVPIA